jgi:hypothetical protein
MDRRHHSVTPLHLPNPGRSQSEFSQVQDEKSEAQNGSKAGAEI